MKSCQTTKIFSDLLDATCLKLFNRFNIINGKTLYDITGKREEQIIVKKFLRNTKNASPSPIVWYIRINIKYESISEINKIK